MPFDLASAQPAPQNFGQNLTGEDYLKTLPTNMATLVKKYAAGELPVSPQMTRSTAGMQLLGAISQYDPTFDATNYQKRQQRSWLFRYTWYLIRLNRNKRSDDRRSARRPRRAARVRSSWRGRYAA